MNIPELSTALANVNLMSQVGIAVLDKAMDNSESAGASLINMMDRSMELSVNPAVGSNFDMYV
ncbi:MAG: YjfB family protein [Lachnospiraceae bacterium]|nr:YjfB family protein [Lachnospiraceae bacterium]